MTRLPENTNSKAGLTRLPRPKYAQRTLIITLIFSFVLVFWTVQLFILMTALDAFFGRQHAILWPAALSSLALTLLTLVLVRLIPKDVPRDM